MHARAYCLRASFNAPPGRTGAAVLPGHRRGANPLGECSSDAPVRSDEGVNVGRQHLRQGPRQSLPGAGHGEFKSTPFLCDALRAYRWSPTRACQPCSAMANAP